MGDRTKVGRWQDADQDGVSDPGELQSLEEAGIASINLESDGESYFAADGDVLVYGESSFENLDGSEGKVGDAAFATSELEESGLTLNDVVGGEETVESLAAESEAETKEGAEKGGEPTRSEAGGEVPAGSGGLATDAIEGGDLGAPEVPDDTDTPPAV